MPASLMTARQALSISPASTPGRTAATPADWLRPTVSSMAAARSSASPSTNDRVMSLR